MKARGDDHLSLPRSDRTRRPHRFVLHALRGSCGWLVRRRNDIRVYGAEQVPAGGPVIFAANHVGVSDGPLLAMFAPRPVHALTKLEMFGGKVGTFLLLAGQIPLDRRNCDPAAIKSCLRLLRDGGSIGIFPEGSRGPGDLRTFHRGAAYLGLVSGAVIQPVSFFGTREPGGHSDSLPPRHGRIDIVFGTPYVLDRQPWPRTREQVGGASTLLREHMLVELERAHALTGRTLPGPLPPGDLEIDPNIGVTDQGAP